MGLTLDIFSKGTFCDNPYSSIYEVPIKNIDNEIFQMNVFKNKNFIIGNVSPSTDIKQISTKIEELKKLKNLDEILIVPTNSLDNTQFSNSEIKEKFKELNNCTILNRVYIKGYEICELYKFLLRNSSLFIKRKGKANDIKNDLTLFLINKNGDIDLLDDKNLDSIQNKLNEIDLIKKVSKVENKIRTDFIQLGKYL